ncbi:MAG: 2-aminoethylphosphonate--pyruvate transaminase [Bacteroidetes bacterium]|jgi:2-aminoethylphosphonate-pyruvate transaminase|nr:2-aminoethylphosphonate--pyruvate transaminase [Bacteroidota bacterium]
MKNNNLLFTPGPLNTSTTVKEAMLRDLGSRDYVFIETVKEIRTRLLALGGVSKDQGYECVIMQGSGTFGIESVLSGVIPQNGKLLLLINGAYGNRMLKIAQRHSISHVALECAENEIPDKHEIENYLRSDASITHVAMVHCETTTGIMNPIDEVGKLCNTYHKIFIVDAMSSFGGVDFTIPQAHIDYLVSSSNKCLEGVPGFSFTLANRAHLEQTKGRSRSLSLDLYAQWQGLEINGQFRFTPPTHALLAFYKALTELENEGGIKARVERYRQNYELLMSAMVKLGFEPYVHEKLRGHIITAFLYPSGDYFDFEMFYSMLNQKGFTIYPGKLSRVDCFRIGNIGQIYEKDIRSLLEAIAAVINEMIQKITV